MKIPQKGDKIEVTHSGEVIEVIVIDTWEENGVLWTSYRYDGEDYVCPWTLDGDREFGCDIEDHLS